MVQNFRRFSGAAAITVIVVALLVLVGWVFDMEALTRVLPAWATMKVNAAIAFLCAGSSLLLQQDPSRQNLRRIGKLCAVLVLTIGTLTLFEYLFGWSLGLDEVFFKEQWKDGILYPGRMAPMTAFIFSLLGVALLLLGDRFATAHQALALASLIPSGAGLIGYLYNANPLYKIGAYVSMAFHTAISFLILGFGILSARPASGFVTRASADDLGGVMLRKLLPRMAVLLVILGWVRLMGQRAGYYDTDFGLSIMVLLSVLVLGILVWQNAGVLSRVDRKRLEADQALISLNRELEQRVEERNRELLRVNEKLQTAVHAREKTIAELQQMQDASLNLMEDLSREVAERKVNEEALRQRTAALQRFQNVTVDREFKMMEMKREVNTLLEKLGLPLRYGMPEK